MSKTASISDVERDLKNHSDVEKSLGDLGNEKSISGLGTEKTISDGESNIERVVASDDVQPPPYTPSPTKATNRRPVILKILFGAIGLCLIPIVIALAVVFSRRDEPRYRMSPKLDTQAMTHQQRADAVRNAYQFAWNGYMQHAFPHDQLLPVTNTFSDPRDGWGASAVDGLDTAIIMGLAEPVAIILKHISTVDYSRPAPGESVSVFETNIRYLGGMLSAYDLLNGPFASLPHDPALRENLLTQSKKLADSLSIAFNTTTGIPDNTLDYDGTKLVRNGSTKANLAEMGSLVLEWSRLSTLLNDPKYAKLTTRAQQYLLNPKPPQAEIFPGLIGSYLSIENGTLIDQTGGWGGGSDSFYEYLIKAYIYDPSKYSSYKDRWVKAADSTMMYLASHPNTRTDLTFLAGFDGTKGVPQSGHCE
jgi:mannosyl-oligosaccharide alpha-1,2-mannosidase